MGIVFKRYHGKTVNDNQCQLAYISINLHTLDMVKGTIQEEHPDNRCEGVGEALSLFWPTLLRFTDRVLITDDSLQKNLSKGKPK